MDFEKRCAISFQRIHPFGSRLLNAKMCKLALTYNELSLWTRISLGLLTCNAWEK